MSTTLFCSYGCRLKPGGVLGGPLPMPGLAKGIPDAGGGLVGALGFCKPGGIEVPEPPLPGPTGNPETGGGGLTGPLPLLKPDGTDGGPTGTLVGGPTGTPLGGPTGTPEGGPAGTPPGGPAANEFIDKKNRKNKTFNVLITPPYNNVNRFFRRTVLTRI